MAEQKGDRDQVLPLTKNILLLFNFIEESARVKIDIRRYPWRRVLHNGENGEGLIFGIYKTPERLKIFHFSEPVYSDKVWLVYRCEDPFVFNSIQDLKNKTIGIVQGSSAGDEFDSQVNVSFKAEYNTSSLAGRFSKLYQKRMDAFLLYEPRTNLREVQRELNQLYASEFDEYRKKKQEIFCINPHPVSVIDAHFALSLQADRSILDKIDKALIQGKKSGELERIFAK
ncbi:substrate-binding periplasmic protein [Undibacterium fentianense]|uniref:Transporter substrate-binding domain-containing protein n=1 Tax=Undibacterium fentianense TaxID=2828728 RepID=A0A941IHQ9_9BURK|nr:transporter substrate-binding domain-containing protein [Undibacterium fentianense]MBR7801225.1 transporter substrate-binding domain-containing protein [Undibacterium fentianense]